MKLTWRTGVGVFIVFVACIGGAVIGSVVTTKFGAMAEDITYIDFISLMLTAISLLMTLLAFFIAILGIIGWNAISRGVRVRVEDFLSDGFKDGNELRLMIDEYVQKSMFEGVNTIDTSLDDE
ncbi:hypothetical protein HY29_18335 [Hyphomonas beringensis]|uniref:Uncharacterized protein n=1 Tax=Hyphomonas beringensis TaxID=1280946 RepID=A0A062TUW7_9PROT|nr:hypothetical protein [Hyphomonas beringensis]KCZ51796.1 hypothetical protein HY29_18335 [Hyphomonas beringensis]